MEIDIKLFQGKTVYRIILLVHQHFQIPQDAAVQILCFVQNADKWLPFFIQIIQPLLNELEHLAFSKSGLQPQRFAQLAVELLHAYG